MVLEMDDEDMPANGPETNKGKRNGPRGPGGNFFVIDKGTWDTVTAGGTYSDNARLNRMIAYLVLASGTGGDQVHTSWSARSIETYTGLGKPRGQVAIDSLMTGSAVAEFAPDSTRMRPRYRLIQPAEPDPIWLPKALIMGLAGETPILRRVKETGDPLLLQLLIDLYAAVQIDATYGVPLATLRRARENGDPDISRKLFEAGAHTVWAVNGEGGWTYSTHELMTPHRIKVKDPKEASAPFWDRVNTLEKIKAVVFEPWVFAGTGDNAEPLFPVSRDLSLAINAPRDATDQLTRLAFISAASLAPGRPGVWTAHEGKHLIPLPGHHQPPSIQHVARLKVEVDARGGRMAYAKRMDAIERWTAIYAELQGNALAEDYCQPMRTGGRASLSR
jgi:hypothetical protein